MKILYITRSRIPTEKAHGLQIVTMCGAYAKLGHDVTLVVPKRQNAIKKDVFSYYKMQRTFNIEYLRVPDTIKYSRVFGRFASWAHAMLFGFRLLFLRPDYNSVVVTRSIEVAWLYSIRGYNVVLEVHNWPRSLEWLFIWLLRPVPTIVANSQGIADELQLHKLNAVVAPNGVDSDKLKLKRGREEMRNELGIDLMAKVFMYIGALEKWKGVGALLEASDELSGIVVIAGGTEEEVSKLRLDYPHVRFLGRTPYSELGDYQNMADVLIIPNDPQDRQSSKYTSPIKLFAHMISGKPIIVTDLPSLRSLVGEDEVFFFDGSSDDLIRTANSVLASSEESEIRAKSAKNKVELCYTWEKRATKIVEATSSLSKKTNRDR